MNVWPITVAARRSLLSVFEQLDDDQWEVRSLCEGWTIREVLAHLTLAARPPAGRYLAALARAKGSFDKANHTLAITDARQPVSKLLTDYRSVIDHRFSPPGWPQAAPLGDILLHSLDVRLPLGLATDQPPEHYEPVLDLLLSRTGRSFTKAGRPDVGWTATDGDWSHGVGPVVRGTIADIALTTAGRVARLDRLTGEGVSVVRDWLA